MLEEEEVEVPVSAAPELPKESTKMDTDEAVNEASKTETDLNMEDAKSASNSSASGVDNGVPESNDKPVEMETDNKVCNLYLFALC